MNQDELCTGAALQVAQRRTVSKCVSWVSLVQLKESGERLKMTSQKTM